jgi:hypothetical protein
MNQKKLWFFIFLSPCIFFLSTQAIQKGSKTFSSIQPFFTFPAADSNKLPTDNNVMLPFGCFSHGFGLQSAATTCTYSSEYPVSGSIAMHGGQLYMTTDLIFHNKTDIASSGFFNANNHMINFSDSITSLPSLFPTTLRDARLFFNQDLTISGTINIKGHCVIDGQNHAIILGDEGNILVAKNAVLTIKNLTIQDVVRNRIRCVNDSGRIILENVDLKFANDFEFSKGSMLFKKQVNFYGPHSFIYSSLLTSTIADGAKWNISGMNQLTIGRSGGNESREPLHLATNSSDLSLENTSLNVTTSGMKLVNGLFNIAGEVFIDTDAENVGNGFQLGDGVEAHDCPMILSPGAVINFRTGVFIFNNVSNGSFFSSGIVKKFVFFAGSKTFIEQNTFIENVNLITQLGATFVNGTEKTVGLVNVLSDDAFAVYDATVISSSLGYILEDAGLINIHSGVFVAPLFIPGVGAFLRGLGDVFAPIFLLSDASELTLGLLGTFFADFSLSGGTLVLEKDAVLGAGVAIVDEGTVDLRGRTFSIEPRDRVWTSTLTFAGDAGVLELRSDMILASSLTFSGNCVIRGDGNILTLVGPGAICLERGASLSIQDTVIEGIHAENIACKDDLGSIEFDDCELFLNDDYVFKKGAFKIRHQVPLYGNGHTFALQTSITSTIEKNSVLSFSRNMTFSYDSLLLQNNKLAFIDSTATLRMSHATIHATLGGLQLQNGTLDIIGPVYLATEGDVFIGDNLNQQHDMVITIEAGSSLIVDQGPVTYQNLNPDSFEMLSVFSVLKLNNTATLILNQDLDIVPGTLLRCPGSDFIENDGAHLTGDTSFAC